MRSPVVGGVSLGLVKGHRFVRNDEARTCALCHGGRVYPEFTGEYGGSADVHYQKGMLCLDCHKKAELHGDGRNYVNRRDVVPRPSCTDCHSTGSEKSEKARQAHAEHTGKASCSACHASAPYRNCSNCHLGEGAAAAPGFFLGTSPRDGKTLTTLRLIPTVRDTFARTGIRQENYDALPNFRDTAPHNIRKRTERTRSCESCHKDRAGYLAPKDLPPEGSRANYRLIPKQR